MATLMDYQLPTEFPKDPSALQKGHTMKKPKLNDSKVLEASSMPVDSVEQHDFFSQLSNDILLCIFSYLGADDISGVQLVCKKWMEMSEDILLTPLNLMKWLHICKILACKSSAFLLKFSRSMDGQRMEMRKRTLQQQSKSEDTKIGVLQNNDCNFWHKLLIWWALF